MHWSERPEIRAIRSRYYDRHLEIGLKFNRGQTEALQAIKDTYEVYDDATEEVFLIAAPKLVKMWRESRPSRRKYYDEMKTPDYQAVTRDLVSWDRLVRQTDYVIASKEMKHEMGRKDI